MLGNVRRTRSKLSLKKIKNQISLEVYNFFFIKVTFVASHCGMKVLSIAMITNCCILDYDNKEIANHSEVVEVANRRALDMETLVSDVVSKMDTLE